MLETNQKKVANLIDQKEEKDFLAREEIKTMEKDTSKLREIEARQERERVGKIKTEEEMIGEKEREKLAEKASLERNLAEKEAREREERIKKMRGDRETKENAQAQINTEKAESITGEFRGALKETQMKEEELRKRLGDYYKIHHLQVPLYRYRMHKDNKTKSEEYRLTKI